MMRSFFEDSPHLLMLSLLEDEKLEPEEIQRLREMIEKRK